MKKFYFRKLLALFLIGTMLGTVGCKDYDDDIDSINKKIDDIEKVTLPGIEEQIEKVKASIPDISALTQSVSKMQGDLSNVTTKLGTLEGTVSGFSGRFNDITSQLSNLSAKLEEVEAKANEYANDKSTLAKSEDVTALRADLQGQIAALKTTLEDSYALKSQLEEYLKTADLKDNATIKELTDAKTTLESAIESLEGKLEDLDGTSLTWQGKSFDEYMKELGYVTGTYTDDDAQKAVLAAITKDNEKYNAEYVAALVELVKNAEVGNDGEAAIKVSDLVTRLNEYKTALAALDSRVAALEGRIQSIVFVPSTITEAQNNTVYFASSSYIEVAGEKYYLTNENVSAATMTFKVSPASIASKIALENVSFAAREITRAAGDAVTFDVKNVEVVKNTDGTPTGEIKVSIETPYTFNESVNPLAFAMTVRIDGYKTETETYQGSEYTTAYMAADAIGGGKINDNLVLVGTVDGKTVELNAATGTYKSEVSYEATGAQTFFSGFKIMYKQTAGTEAPKYVDPTTLWSNLKVDFTAPKTAATVTTGLATDYTLAATSFTFKKAGNTGTIGNIITSADYSVKVSTGELKNQELYAVKQAVTVIGKETPYTTDAAAITWNYKTATSDGLYKAENLKVNNMPLSTYKNLMTYTYAATGAEKTYSVKVMKDGQAYTAFTVDENTFKLTANPSVEGDALLAAIQFKPDWTKVAAGEYEVVATYVDAAGVATTITAPMTVTAMPALVGEGDNANIIGVTVTEPYQGLTATVLDDFTKKIAYNEAAHKVAFGDKTTFDAFIAAFTTKKATADGVATPTLDDKAVKVTVTSEFEYGKAYKPVLVLQDAANLGAEVTVNISYTISKTDATLTPNTTWSNTIKGAFSGNVYGPIADAPVTAYTYLGTIENTKVTYTVVAEESKYSGTKAQAEALAKMAEEDRPVVNADNTLSWNKWAKLSIILKATLTDANGIVLTEEYFTMNLQNPLKSQSITTKNQNIYLDTARSLDLAAALSLKAMDNAEIFDTTQESGLNAAKAAALGAEVKFEFDPELSDTDKQNFTIAGKTLTVAESVQLLTAPRTFTVKATYTTKFGTDLEVAPVSFTVTIQQSK